MVYLDKTSIKLEIKLEEEKDIDYIENIKIRFKDKELYYGNYKERSNMALLNEGTGGIKSWTINSLAIIKKHQIPE